MKEEVMSITKKPTGIIYRAYNTISKKSYCGQTVKPLKVRIRQHYSHARKNRHKFANALLAYEKEVWEWSVLKEVPIEELSKYEMYFIKELDTFQNGYNTLDTAYIPKEHDNRYDRKIINLYHKEHGLVSGYSFQILQLEPKLHHYLYKLLKGEYKHLQGWILAENKDKYDEILGIYEFYNPEVGVVKCTPKELDSRYVHPLIPESERKCSAARLIQATNPLKYYYGWILLKNKEKFEKESEARKVTLHHETYGTYRLFPKEFEDQFGLNHRKVSELSTGKYKKCHGWSLVKEE